MSGCVMQKSSGLMCSPAKPEPERWQLMKAARTGKLGDVKKVLLGKTALTTQDMAGMTALHHASLEGKLDIVQWLISQGKPN